MAGTVRVCLVLCSAIVGLVEGFTDVYPQLRAARAVNNEDAGRPLFLTPLIESGHINEAREKATVQHKEMGDVGSYAGYLTVNKQYNSNMFFWFFPAMQSPKTAPVVLWLQGGPGVSSMYGLFLENGPFFVTTNETLKMRKYSWGMSHSLLYIDNPVGTGFSFTENDKGYATSETDVGRDVTNALVQFFKLFPELQANDFFVTGESYGGKYVPAVSYTIKTYNAKAETKINLKGLAIGNGLTVPEHQLRYGDFLYQLGLIDVNGRNTFYDYEKRGHELVQQKKYEEAFDVFDRLIGGDLTKEPSVFKNLTGLSFYFNILYTEDPNLPDAMLKWIERPDIRRAIHVGNNTFNFASTKVEEKLKDDVLQSMAYELSQLLESYKVLIYNGQLDIIVGYTTVENYLRQLNWSGAEKYKKATRKIWFVNKEIAGYSKTVDNLTEILVRNSGHTVPADQPQWALDMITRFTHNKPF